MLSSEKFKKDNIFQKVPTIFKQRDTVKNNIEKPILICKVYTTLDR